ncbi:GtrA family protein [Ruminococcus sp.]|uniref:GtrA family protein n=1 Tax=Ruminococcus sp. TaxID=41978 RepID=UPI00386F95D0
MKKLYNWFASWGITKALMKKSIFQKLLSYEFLMYLFFGVLTTIVSFAILFACQKIMPLDKLLFNLFGFAFTWDIIAQAISWILACTFAFVTNKYFVFESRERSPKVIFKEYTTFMGGRVISFLAFEEGLYILLDRLILSNFLSVNASKYISKVIVAVFVVIFNYLVGKFVSFRKKDNRKETVEE